MGPAALLLALVGPCISELPSRVLQCVSEQFGSAELVFEELGLQGVPLRVVQLTAQHFLVRPVHALEDLIAELLVGETAVERQVLVGQPGSPQDRELETAFLGGFGSRLAEPVFPPALQAHFERLLRRVF